MSVRISRGTLRKAQAIEDDDNLPAGENGAATNATDTLRLHTLSVPSTRLSNNSGGSFEEEDSYNKVAQFLGNATHAIAHATFAGHQTLANPLPLPVNANTINEAAISFYLQQQQQQQQQIKPETLTADNILNWTNNELMKNQLFSFAKQQSTTLSSLGLPSFVQSHSVDITTPHSLDDMRSVTGNVSGLQPPPVMLDRKPASFDMSKFADSRNVHSTESQASTSSDSTLRDMPRKSFIQEDIRLGKGRFQLVRKRGRSDVWNLFGQVMDTMTNQRLPYVACYACKVLYTDTGGGTGNMTRHRCPLGASYRSITSSSTDTMGESFNNQSSFESFHGASPDTEKSPTTTVVHTLTVPRMAESVHVTTTNQNLLTPSRALHPPTSLSTMHLHNSLPSTDTMPPVLSSGGSLSFDVPSTPGAPPTIVVSQTPQTNNDIIISPSVEAERRKVVRFVAQYCISSFELPNIVIKPSFVRVLENSFESAKRLYGTPSNVNNTPLKSFSELLPTEAVLSKMIHDEASEIRLKLRAQFQATKNIGIMLVCQRLIYGNRELITVWTSFVNSAWEYEKVCIAVGEKSIELKTILACVAETYGFTSAENVYVVLDDHVNPSNRPELPSNMTYMENVVFAINNILTCAINESSIKSEIIDMIKVYHSITKDANDVAFNGTIRGFVPFRGNILDDDGQNIVNALDLFQLLKYVRMRFETLKQHPEVLSKPEVRQKLEDYKVAQNLECFLEPFFEVVQEFDADAQPHFHTILPQWHSLIHECGNGDDDDEVMAMTLASRPRRRSLRHQKSIDDEPVLQVDESRVDLPAPPILDNNAWFNSLRQSILKQLKAWATEHINTKHMIATVLNPRMRKLPIICTDTERVTTYSYIRQYAGLIAASKQEPRAENSIEAQDYEPQKKRQNFLSKLENHGMVQDELDKYLNMQFSSHDGRCVTSFWSGAESLGKLRQYARAILPLVAAAPPLKMRYIGNQSLSTVDLSEMLLLKTAQAFTDKPKSSKS